MKFENVFKLLENITEENSEKTSLGIKTTIGWKEFSYKGLGLIARQLASYLINDLQIEKAEKIAILSESMPEFGACVFGSVLAGLTIVPLDNKLTIYELKSILSNCEPVVIMASASNFERAKELKSLIPSIQHIIMMEKVENDDGIQSIYSIPKNYNAKWRRRPLNDTGCIIYTSGTTGAPKGVEITFKNMLAQTHDLRIALNEIMPDDGNTRILSILPMNHLFELTVGFFTFLNLGYSIYYTKSLKPKDIIDIMKERKIRYMIIVPAFLRLLKTYIEAEISKFSGFEKFKYNLFYPVAKFLPYCVKKVVFASIHKKFGGNFYGCISGGAPLEPSVGEFFQNVGIRVNQGYGLSEASPVVSLNRGKYQNLSSVGHLLESLEAKIDAETGELLVKGPSVMKGYYKRPDLTSDVITEDGWLHTGDIAKIDEHGLIYITGRIKNMIVLSGGKKVFPEEVEAVLEQSTNFAEFCVMGLPKTFGEKDGQEEIAAVIVPAQSLLDKYPDDKELEKAVITEVKQLSMQLAHYKRPLKIIIQKEKLPRTSTNKVKRKEVKEKYKA